jgi:hypothetical protein
VAGFCENGNELLGSMKFGEFLYKIRKCKLQKRKLLHGDGQSMRQADRQLVG